MKKILYLVIPIIVIVGAYAFYLFNKKVGGLEQIKPDFELTANQLYDAFATNETEATQKFTDKVILVNGTVESFNLTDSIATVTLKADNAMLGGINCSFPKNNFTLNQGDEVQIKGRCQGYLMEVILNNCVQVK